MDRLEYITNLCPIIYGKAIYQATALLQPITAIFYLNEYEMPQGFDLYEQRDIEIPNDSVDLISVYPNPLENSDIHVRLDIEKHPGATFNLYDMLGQLVNTGVLLSSENEIILNGISPGNYLCIIRDSDGTIIFQGKIVKL